MKPFRHIHLLIRSRRTRRVTAGVLILGLFVLLGARFWVNRAAYERVYSDTKDVPACRVAMVLGAKIMKNGKLSEWLQARCDKAIELYKSGKCQKLLMSGDNRFENYSEPDRMREYAIAKGVPAKDVVADYAGRRTYDSIYRAKHIFGIDRMIIVTQDFHVPRAIFLSKAIGVDAYGVTAPAAGKFKSEIRECFACASAILDVHVLNPRPVLGKKEKI